MSLSSAVELGDNTGLGELSSVVLRAGVPSWLGSSRVFLQEVNTGACTNTPQHSAGLGGDFRRMQGFF